MQIHLEKKKIYIVTGPTASGKSALAVELARELGTDVVSADSRQIYKGIPIITAVPTLEERKGVTHHFLETLPLEAYYSAAMFAEEGGRIVRQLLEEKGSAVVAGGSMMYLDALFGAIDDIPTVLDDIRQGVVAEFEEKGEEWLRDEVLRLDPATAARLDPKNLKRWLHALEISRQTGKPYSSFLKGTLKGTRYEGRGARGLRDPEGTRGHRQFGDAEVVRIVLEGDREVLFDRINRRAELMLEAGMVDEARAVYHLRHLNSLNTVGIKEMFAYFDGEMTLAEAVARMQKNTRVFAKKQLTWLKRAPLGADYADRTIRLPFGSKEIKHQV